jgi:CheY-like chemotaxis protein
MFANCIRPNAMIVDFAVPRMNGAELARLARFTLPDLLIAFASGYAETDIIWDVLTSPAAAQAVPGGRLALSSSVLAHGFVAQHQLKDSFQCR